MAVRGSLKPVKQIIRIATRGGEAREIQAEVFGDHLALHRDPSPGAKSYEWSITHLRSGLRVEAVIGKKALAVEVIKMLASEGEWEFGSFGEVGYLRDQPAKTQAAMNKAQHMIYPETWNEDGTLVRKEGK